MYYDDIEGYALWLLQYNNREDIILREIAFRAEVLQLKLAGLVLSDSVSEEYTKLDNALQVYKLLMKNEITGVQNKALYKSIGQ